MKKIMAISLLFVFVFVGIYLPDSSHAEEYIIQKGDILCGISQMTGNTINQLSKMNNIENPDLIYTGKKIVFLSKEDIRDALVFLSTPCLQCSKSQEKKWTSDRQLLMENKISYAEGESGLSFHKVLKAAALMRFSIGLGIIRNEDNRYHVPGGIEIQIGGFSSGLDTVAVGGYATGCAQAGAVSGTLGSYPGHQPFVR